MSISPISPSSYMAIIDSREKNIKKDFDLAINKTEKIDDKKLRKACESFEAIFLKQLLSAMRKTVQDGLFTSGKSEQIFRDMMDTELCNEAAKSRSLGIADMLYKDITKKMIISSELNKIQGEGL